MHEILLIDDDADDAELTIFALRKNHLANPIVHIDDGEKAMEFLFDGGGTPGLILLDLKMPGVTGYDVIRWVRNDSAYSQMKIVIITGQTSVKSAPEAKMVDAVCIKPMAIPKLIEQVKLLMVESV